MENIETRKIIEALLFASDQPISLNTFKTVLGEKAKDLDIKSIIQEIADEYKTKDSPFEIRYIAGGWQFSTKKEFADWIKKLYKGRTTLRLSNSALETLSIVAYKQPITRSEIEEIRGVESSGVLDTLLERRLVKILGRKEVLGRPMLFGTTQDFLRHFGLSHLSELPSLEEFIKEEMQNTQNAEGENVQELPFDENNPNNDLPEKEISPADSGEQIEGLYTEKKDESVLN
jgi:segregation and condensation protein B